MVGKIKKVLVVYGAEPGTAGAQEEGEFNVKRGY